MADPVFDILVAGSGSTAVATGGTITFQYPTGLGPTSYWCQWPARMNVRALQGNYVQDTDFTIVYGPTTIVVTYNGSSTIPANVAVGLQLPRFDTSDQFDQAPVTALSAPSTIIPGTARVGL